MGASGSVTIHHLGDIETTGSKAHGIVAQSIAGTTGTLNGSNYSGLAGTVTVTTDGRISAGGGNAHAIVAQSPGRVTAT
jgi:hypothetical protein